MSTATATGANPSPLEIVVGCRVYCKGWPHGWLWVSAINHDGTLALDDDNGRRIFSMTQRALVYHVGPNHAQCKGPAYVG